ncbi:MAG TPA: purine-binding chemotaxis protein CheW [Gammaproteobacteria bacterium]|nr:purine-binding chemotaxis protein CheW [Gammaproteobacteria bacterium]
MLMLSFQLGNGHYAIPAQEVVEVLPRLELDPVARVPAWIAGLLDYRGTPVPVLDLCRLIAEQPCRNTFGSRIIMVDFVPAGAAGRLLGLLAEGVHETLRLDEEEFSEAGLPRQQAPYLGQATRDGERLIERIRVNELIPPSIRKQLFPAEAG